MTTEDIVVLSKKNGGKVIVAAKLRVGQFAVHEDILSNSPMCWAVTHSQTGALMVTCYSQKVASLFAHIFDALPVTWPSRVYNDDQLQLAVQEIKQSVPLELSKWLSLINPSRSGIIDGEIL